MKLANIKIAIVHYWFLELHRGGERVVDSLCELFPQADVFTHVFDEGVFSDLVARHRVKTFINRLPFARKATLYYVPLMPFATEQFDLSGYDLVISSESGPAKKGSLSPKGRPRCLPTTHSRTLFPQPV
jgi:hypothetical protein